MTTKFKTATRDYQDFESFTCDRCKKIIDLDDMVGIQEMLHWTMRGGYGSVFGDGCLATLDLCQECTNEALGKFIQYPEEVELGEDE